MKKFLFIFATLLFLSSCVKQEVITETIYSDELGKITVSFPNAGTSISPNREILLFEVKIEGFKGFRIYGGLDANFFMEGNHDISDFLSEIRMEEAGVGVTDSYNEESDLGDEDVYINFNLSTENLVYEFDGEKHVFQCWGKATSAFPMCDTMNVAGIDMRLVKFYDDGENEIDYEVDYENNNHEVKYIFTP